MAMWIGELASRSGLTASAIRYYERAGLLGAAIRKSGRRVYDATALPELALIRFAKATGFTLPEIKDTFENDEPLSETEPMIRRLAEKLWSASRQESRIARTVVLKLKTSEFKILTRSHTPGSPPSSCEELTRIALALRERVDLDPQRDSLSCRNWICNRQTGDVENLQACYRECAMGDTDRGGRDR